MSRIFDIVQEMSGQRSTITIPRPYLKFFKGEQQAHALAAVLNQLVFWSGHSSIADGWFYKTHQELGEEVGGLSDDQVARLVDKLVKKLLPGVIETDSRKVNGTPVKHYKINDKKLIRAIFPSNSDSAKSRNGKREVTESIPQSHEMETAKSGNDSREVAESYLYTDPYTDTDLQITKTPMSGNSDESQDENNNFLAKHPEAVVFNTKKRQWGSEADLICAKWIWGKVTKLYQSSTTQDGTPLQLPKEPDFTSWSNEVRLMCEQDGRNHKSICELFSLANKDDFWKTNVKSPCKLRAKWDELTLKLAANHKQDFTKVSEVDQGGISGFRVV